MLSSTRNNLERLEIILRSFSLVLLLSILFSGCSDDDSEPEITSGIIYYKIAYAPYTTTDLIMIGDILVPTNTDYPARWYVDIQNCPTVSAANQTPEKCKTRRVAVTQQGYEQFQIGQQITFQ